MANWKLKQEKKEGLLAALRRAGIHGSTRIADECGISKQSVNRILASVGVRAYIIEPVFVRLLGFDGIDPIKRTREQNQKIAAMMNEFCDRDMGDAVKEPHKETRLEYMSAYAKFLTLKDRRSEPPAYRKYIPRLKEEIEIYDEVVVVRTMLYNEVPRNVHIAGYSSGVVDIQPIVPLRERLITNKVIATASRQEVEHLERLPGHPLIQAAVSYYNGLQHPNESIGFEITEDCAEISMVVDLTSLPITAEELFAGQGPPVALHIRVDADGRHVGHWMDCRPSESGNFIISSRRPGIASDAIEGWNPEEPLLKDDAIEVRFAFDWAAVQRMNTMPPEKA